MLNEVLYQLKSVPGVSGVFVLDKAKNSTYQLLPASFSQMAIKNLTFRLLKLTREAPYKNGIENHVLVSAFNQVASKYREALGSFSVTKNLRKSKDKILPQYPFLSNFFVDNYGAVSLLAGHITATDYQLLEGIAHWLKGFKALCDVATEGVLRETSIREMTSPYKMDLENSGFYNILDQVVYE